MATPLSTSRPDLAGQWHSSLNGLISPDEVSAGSNKKVWWFGTCGHEWQATVHSRASGRGCPFCSGNAVLAGFNDLTTKFPEIASQWDFEVNGDSRPEHFTAGSKRKFFWICPLGHSWLASIDKRVSGRGCSICRNLTFVQGINDLGTLRPDIALQWDEERNGDLKPSQVGIGSEIKVWWLCALGHSFDSNIDSRCRDGKGCRICAGRALLIGFNDLATKHPELAQEFHPSKNGDLRPDAIHSGQPKKYWWLGTCGHEWQASLTYRVSRLAGCPQCSPGGYTTSQEGIIYFLANDSLRAFKIGITNLASKNDRLQGFCKLGWRIVFSYKDADGRVPLEMETSLFRWLRQDLRLPIYLTKADMGNLNGSSETFSMDSISESEILEAFQKRMPNA